MKRFFLFARFSISIVLLLVSFTLNAQGNDVTLLVSGDGPTKKDATANALRSAIEQAYGTFVSSSTVIFNDELVKEEIATVASGNIKSYDELSSVVLPNGNVSVTLSAIVSVDNLISYSTSHGYSAEFSGARFAMNEKLKRIEKENEEKALRIAFEKARMISERMFDIRIRDVSDKIENVGLVRSVKMDLGFYFDEACYDYCSTLEKTFHAVSTIETLDFSSVAENVGVYESHPLYIIIKNDIIDAMVNSLEITASTTNGTKIPPLRFGAKCRGNGERAYRYHKYFHTWNEVSKLNVEWIGIEDVIIGRFFQAYLKYKQSRQSMYNRAIIQSSDIKTKSTDKKDKKTKKNKQTVAAKEDAAEQPAVVHSQEPIYIFNSWVSYGVTDAQIEVLTGFDLERIPQVSEEIAVSPVRPYLKWGASNEEVKAYFKRIGEYDKLKYEELYPNAGNYLVYKDQSIKHFFIFGESGLKEVIVKGRLSSLGFIDSDFHAKIEQSGYDSNRSFNITPDPAWIYAPADMRAGAISQLEGLREGIIRFSNGQFLRIGESTETDFIRIKSSFDNNNTVHFPLYAEDSDEKYSYKGYYGNLFFTNDFFRFIFDKKSGDIVSFRISVGAEETVKIKVLEEALHCSLSNGLKEDKELFHNEAIAAFAGIRDNWVNIEFFNRLYLEE